MCWGIGTICPNAVYMRNERQRAKWYVNDHRASTMNNAETLGLTRVTRDVSGDGVEELNVG